jgi:hypothetical protein
VCRKEDTLEKEWHESLSVKLGSLIEHFDIAIRKYSAFPSVSTGGTNK